MHTMKKTMFGVFHDDKINIDYVAKIEDEATKNHRETNQPIHTNFMPENRDNPMCPVRSFKLYMSHLNPENDYLWQTPNHHPKDKGSQVFYTIGHLGKNTLGTFMSELSKTVGLSKIYTNHCIRVTGASILSRCKFNNKEVMSMTGHKSVQSLTIYQRVQEKTKIKMGQVLGASLSKDDDDLLKQIENAPTPLQLQAPPPKNPSPVMAIEAPPPSNVNQEILPFEPNFEEDTSNDIDWLKYLCEVEQQTKELPQFAASENKTVTPQTDTKVSNTMMQRNSPMFAGCKIGNINITINKN